MGAIKQKVKGIAIKAAAIVGIPIVVLGGIIGSFFNTTSAYSGDYSAFTNLGDYIVKTDEEGAMPAMNSSQLKTAIEACYSGQQKDNMLSVLNDLVSVQDEYKVNAAFMVAITHIESSGGTDWDAIDSSTYNWMSVSYGEAWNGEGGQIYSSTYDWCCYSSFNEAIQKFGVYMTESSHYFRQGKYTVEEIAPTYCNVAWGDSIKAELDKLYSAVAATMTPSGNSGAQAVEGDGYSEIYTNAGKTYKLFEQWTGSYSGKTWEGSTFSSGGCGPTSVAIILTGFGINKSPDIVVSECAAETQEYGARTIGSLAAYFRHYGLSAKEVYSFTSSDQTAIINHLKAGTPVLLHITQPIELIDGSRATTTRHYVTLLGINSQNQIFVGDPGSGKTDGLTTMENIVNKSKAIDYILVSK